MHVSVTLPSFDNNKNDQSVNDQKLPSNCANKRKSVEESDQSNMTDAKKAKHINSKDALRRKKRLEKCREYEKKKRACELVKKIKRAS